MCLVFVWWFFTLLAARGYVVTSDIIRIRDAGELIEVSSSVNGGANFSGTTVLLDSDIDFSEELSQQFEPIGKYRLFEFYIPFLGTFDGQGHTISNLKINSTLESTGLFGYSEGSTIKNVVLDSSCSFVSFYESGNAIIGGIIGMSDAKKGPFNIENAVNMASAAFNGVTSNDYVYMGGIAAEIYSSSSHAATVKNCANYGSITNYGKSLSAYIAGVVGYSQGPSAAKGVGIFNSFNYGPVALNGTTQSYSYIGGIIGCSKYSSVENCLDAGKIASNEEKIYVGSFVGCSYSTTKITHSFWVNGIGYNESSAISVSIDDESSQVSLNLEVVGKLNNYSSKNSWNNWLLNSNGATVTFRVNDYKGLEINSKMILIPDLSDNDERTFSGWYNDEALTAPFASSGVESGTTLYGMFCGSSYTVKFDANGGGEPDVKRITIKCNGTYEALPVSAKNEHTLIGWFTERAGGDKIELGERVSKLADHTLYAHWKLNEYTVTFVFNNGTEPEVRVFVFNETVTYPVIPVREGHTFSGWSEEISFMPSGDRVIEAQWKANNYTITFVFNNGESDHVKVLEFNSTIDYPKNVEKEGEIFNGWDKIITFVPAENVTVKALWREKPIEYVEVVLEKKEVTMEEAKKIIEEYTTEEFIIERIVTDETTGEIKIIVVFADPDKSTEFIRYVNENRRQDDSRLKRVNGASYDKSLSFIFSPSALFNFMFA